MRTSAAPYDINRDRSAPDKDTCAATGRALTIGELHVVALLETIGEESLQRIHYSMDAWNEGVELPEGATLFGFWKRRVPEPGQDDKPSVVSDDELMDLFEQLEGTDQDAQITFRYLLALMLMRKRRLELVRMLPKEGGEPTRILVRQRITGGGGPEHEVVDPGMDDQRVAEGIEQLGRVVSIDQE